MAVVADVERPARLGVMCMSIGDTVAVTADLLKRALFLCPPIEDGGGAMAGHTISPASAAGPDDTSC